ncbi:rho operon leader peptide [Citrobacter amalonaticus]|uniref:Rho operon leader peptide n=1 Tax=Citrobacter amalonaticus TaxID=35703 RepID=A0A2S4RQX5_CITAM|nr:rho operon leader peptide [Citrobacter amalonaticus]POT54556.1 rho operon leader peptide [Citrobacter amalonaticus]POT69501.1 rho operon leader peptide [Citrobacter amalonaticus]POU60312.1 rho operon leader peptide [Citrobacter amalonaticus]POV02607.1 rho operon leader peptide [Citrobacter amalonaticus]
MLPVFSRARSRQIPGLSFNPSCRFSSVYFPVTRQRTDMS